MNAAKYSNKPPIQYTNASRERRAIVTGFIVNHVEAMQPISRKALRQWLKIQVIGIDDDYNANLAISDALRDRSDTIFQFEEIGSNLPHDQWGEKIIDLV